jgi:murein DD-endopeptidase MepM/ murein hydrolase activator NlpD
VKTDYKHKTTVHSAQQKSFAPSLLRLIFFTALAILFSWGWYVKHNSTDGFNFLSDGQIITFSEPVLEDVLPELGSDEHTIHDVPVELTADDYNPSIDALDLTTDENNAAVEALELVSSAPALSIKENQSEHKPIANKSIWEEFEVAPGRNLSYHLGQVGVSSKMIHDLLDVQHKTKLTKVYPGQVVRVRIDPRKNVQALNVRLTPTKSILVEPQANGRFCSQLIEKPIETRNAMAGATIQDSLYLAGKKARLSDSMIMELADIFAYDIDFALDIRPNDYFKVVFEEYFDEGVKVDHGPILAAEFVNQGKRFTVIRYDNEDGKPSYFTPDGRGIKRAFIRTPVEYTRISSHFNLKRRHPVLHHIRAHKGVDYAAPMGTPVKAVGNGKVSFIGKKGGYGNVIVLQHGKLYSTLYAHLHRFQSKLKVGTTVKQSEVIGFVGKSGLATGPHLHYEFRINDVHHNPLTVALPQSDPLPPKTKQLFIAKAKEYQHLLKLQENIMLAKNEKNSAHN